VESWFPARRKKVTLEGKPHLDADLVMVSLWISSWMLGEIIFAATAK